MSRDSQVRRGIKNSKSRPIVCDVIPKFQYETYQNEIELRIDRDIQRNRMSSCCGMYFVITKNHFKRARFRQESNKS